MRSWTTQGLLATPPAKSSGSSRPTRGKHGQGAFDDGGVQAQGDILGPFAPGHEADGLGLGEHGAHRVDLQPGGAAKGVGAELLQGDLKHRGQVFEKFTGAGGAAIVHLEFAHPAILEGNGLGILAAYIKHGACLGKEVAGPQSVGLDFGDRLHLRADACSFHQTASIAGGHQFFTFDVLGQQANLAERIKGGGRLLAADDLVRIAHHQLDGARSDVDATEHNHYFTISTKASIRVLSCSTSSML